MSNVGLEAELRISNRDEIEFLSPVTFNLLNDLGSLVESQRAESPRSMILIAAQEMLSHDLGKPEILAVKRP